MPAALDEDPEAEGRDSLGLAMRSSSVARL